MTHVRPVLLLVPMDETRRSEPLLARLADRNLRFPRQPRLAPDLDIFAMPDGLGFQFRGGQSPVVLRGPIAEKLIAFLLPLLDGSHQVPELLSKRPAELPEAAVLRTLSLMHMKGLLVEGEKPCDESDGLVGKANLPFPSDTAMQRQLLFWGRSLNVSRSARYPHEVQCALESAQLVVVATGLFGIAVCDLLMRSGCTSLRILDWDEDGYLGASVGDMATEFVHMDVRSVEAAGRTLVAWVPFADLVITATRNGCAKLFRAVNKLSLEHRRPWLRGNFDGCDLEVGPYVNPYNSSCYRCLELREASAMDAAIEERIYQDRLANEDSAGKQAPLGEGLFTATLGASILVGEVIRIITNIAPPTLLDHVLRVSTVTGTMETTQILRLPRCPECYQGVIDWQSIP
jgi:bacteriocin biosynthesis cyclodehydratase domain-containing protein